MKDWIKAEIWTTYLVLKYWEHEEEICQQIYCQMKYEDTMPWD